MENKVQRISRLAVSTFITILLITALYAVVFLQRADHLMTAGMYGLVLWAINKKKNEDNKQS